MTSRSLSHSCIVSFCLGSGISFISVTNFAFIGQIHLAIMNISRRNLNSSNKTIIFVHSTMKLITEIGFGSLLRPFSIFAPSSFSFISARRISFSVTRIGGDKRCILHDSFLHLEIHSIKLFLHLVPNIFVLSAFGEAFSEFPDSGGIRNDFCCSQEHPEGDAITNSRSSCSSERQ